jgi:hypothetical protein
MITWGYGNNLLHCIEQWELRISKDYGRMDVLLKILENSIPEDWRLSRFSTGFVVLDELSGAILLGKQGRLAEWKRKKLKLKKIVFKDIHTVMNNGGFNTEKTSNGIKPPFAGRPNVVVCLDGSVRVRQWEKVLTDKVNETSTQYLRMHLIDKEKMNQSDFLWLKWALRGTHEWFKPGQNPPEDYSGEDYWRLPQW